MKFSAMLAALTLGSGLLANVRGADVLELHGSGTTNPQKLMWKTMSILETRAKVPIRMTYRAVGSGTGQKEFIGESPDFGPLGNFGSGDIPFSKDNYDAMIGRGQELMHIPFLMGAISFFHSIPSSLPLDLNACLLARIFNLDITMWDHEDILAFGDNQALATIVAGKKINVVRRVFGSSSTSIATGYLKVATEAQGCPATWPANMVGKGDADKTTLEPTKAPYWGAGTVKAQGSGGVASSLAANEFSISYLDAGHGIAEGFAEVKLQNKDGVILNSQEADLTMASQKSTSVPTDMSADWSAASLLDAPGAETWPMMTFSYLYVKQDMSSMGQSGALVRALVEFLLSAEGQDMLADFSFQKLPESLITKGLTAIASAKYADGVDVWEFEDATKTQAYNGAKSHIFSGKRQNWDQFVLGGVVESIGGVDDLHIEHDSYETRILALEAEHGESGDSGASSAVSTSQLADDFARLEERVTSTRTTATVALILVILTSLVLVGALKANADLKHRIGVLERVGASVKGGFDNYSEAGSQKGLVLSSGPI
jgi:ABC-type phosphate transport system substrate-binding protein